MSDWDHKVSWNVFAEVKSSQRVVADSSMGPEVFLQPQVTPPGGS